MFAVYAENPQPGQSAERAPYRRAAGTDHPRGLGAHQNLHANLNRHDLFTLQGITHHPEPLRFPIILGNDGAGTLDDGNTYCHLSGGRQRRLVRQRDAGFRWHIFSEFLPGTFADTIAIPQRNAIWVPDGMSMEVASLLGTAWLTAYRALFVRAGMIPGQRLLVHGARGGMATALIQLAAAAGIEVWATSRDDPGSAYAELIDASRTFRAGVHPSKRRPSATLPRFILQGGKVARRTGR